MSLFDNVLEFATGANGVSSNLKGQGAQGLQDLLRIGLSTSTNTSYGPINSGNTVNFGTDENLSPQAQMVLVGGLLIIVLVILIK